MMTKKKGSCLVSDFEEKQEVEKSEDTKLVDALMKASRLMRQRKGAMIDERRAAQEKSADQTRALKLLMLKDEMEQREMADLLDMRLRELDANLAEMEEAGLVERRLPEEEDMRAIAVSITETGREACEQGVNADKDLPLVPGFADEDRAQLIELLEGLNAAFEALGLSDERPQRGGRDDRGGRGFRGGRDDRGPRGGRDDRGPRGGRDDRGPRGGRDDRSSRGNDRSGYRGGRDDRDSRGGYRGNRDARGGYRGGRDDRGGRADRGGRDDRRGGYRSGNGTQSARYDHKDRSDRDDRGGRGFGRRY